MCHLFFVEQHTNRKTSVFCGVKSRLCIDSSGLSSSFSLHSALSQLHSFAGKHTHNDTNISLSPLHSQYLSLFRSSALPFLKMLSIALAGGAGITFFAPISWVRLWPTAWTIGACFPVPVVTQFPSHFLFSTKHIFWVFALLLQYLLVNELDWWRPKWNSRYCLWKAAGRAAG